MVLWQFRDSQNTVLHLVEILVQRMDEWVQIAKKKILDNFLLLFLLFLLLLSWQTQRIVIYSKSIERKSVAKIDIL